MLVSPWNYLANFRRKTCRFIFLPYVLVQKKTPNRSLFFLERNRLIREITELINQINATHERLTKQGRIRSDHGLRYLEDDLYISVVSILKSFNDRFSRKKIRGFTNLCWEEDGITLQIELL